MGITLADAIINILPDDSKVGGVFGRVRGMTNNLVTGIGLGVGSAIANGLGRVAAGVGDLVGEMVGGNAQFEQYNTQFEVLLGSAEAAEERMADLADFGARTPFELPQVVEADRILQGFGLHAEEVAEQFGFAGKDIRTIAGDVASGTGSSFQEMALLIGKFSAGATGEAIARMSELGITNRAELAALGLEFDKSGSLLSPLPEAMETVLTLMQDKYGGLMDAQSGTFNGMLSNLQDWKAATLRRIGEPIFELLKDKLGTVLEFLGSPAVMGAIDNFATTLTNGIGGAVDWLNTTGLPALRAFFVWLTTQGIPQFQAFIQPIVGRVLPALQQLGNWFTTTLVPLANTIIQFLSWKDALIILAGVVLSVLLPALISLAISLAAVTWPILALIAVVALLRTAWEENWGGIRDILTDFWENSLKPALVALSDHIVNKVIPTAKQLGVIIMWALNQAGIAAHQLAFIISIKMLEIIAWWERVKTAARQLWFIIMWAFNQAGIAARQLVVIVLGVALQIIAWWERVKTAAKQLAAIVLGAMLEIGSAVNGAITWVQGLWDSIKGFWEWLQGKVFSFQINLPKIPDWMIPGSPTPFELGIRGIHRALDDLASVQPLNLGAAIAPALAGAATGGAGSFTSQDNFQFNVGNARDAELAARLVGRQRSRQIREFKDR